MKALVLSLALVSVGVQAQTLWAPQVNADWNSSGGVSLILNKPSLSTVATSGAYTDLTGKPTLATVASTGNFADLISKPTTLAGYGITDGVSSSTLSSTLAGYVSTTSLSSTLSGYVTSTSLTSTLSGYATTSALTSGLATKFATPTGTTSQYLRGDGTLSTFPAVGAGSVTSVALTSTNLTVTGSPITTSGTLAIALPNVGTAGTYSGVTTDATGRVTAGTVRGFSYPTRALATCFQASATRDANFSYAVDVTTSMTLAGTPQGSAALRIYTDSACTLGGQTVITGTNGMPTSLSVTVGQSIVGSVPLAGTIPAGYYARIETTINSGSSSTVTFATRQGQEVLQ